MPAPTDEVVIPQFLKGVDFTNDARISNPGAWKELSNLYARSPGVIATRPGSKLLASQIVAPNRAADPSIVVTGVSTTKWGRNWIAAKGALDGSSNLEATVPAASTHRGISSLWPRFSAANIPLDTTFPTQTANTQGASYINGITRAYVPALNRSVYFGAARRGAPHTDFLWWLNEGDGQMRAIPDLGGHISGSGDDWTFLPIQSNRNSLNAHQDFDAGLIAFATNGAGRLLGIFKYNDATDPYEVKALNVRARAYSGPGYGYDVSNVQSLCMYGGQVVIGGFDLIRYDEDGAVKQFGNCIAFIDIDPVDGGMSITDIGGVDSFTLAGETSKFYFIRIGDDLSERVRCVMPVASLSDARGIQGGLAVFTDKKVLIYQNPPPTGGNPNGQEFHVTAMGDVGCAAAKSVVRTPHGVVFLGTDGIFYLIGLDNTILPISRSIQPEFVGMSPKWHRKVCAYYDGEFYKVFYPDRPAVGARKKGEPLGTNIGDWAVNPVINSLHMYCDLRYLTRSRPDLGALWYGVHDGLNVSCVVRAIDMEDFGEVVAGTGHTCALLKLDQHHLRTDPRMGALTSATRIPQWRAISGDWDGGEIHVDKTITAFRAVIRGPEYTRVWMGISTNGHEGTSSGYEVYTTVQPPGTEGSPGPVANGAESFAQEDGMIVAALIPPEVLRGKTFEFSLRAEDEIGVHTAFSDLELTLKRIGSRRNTTLAPGDL